MFNTLQPMAADPILKLINLYQASTSINKIDLGVGVYKDEIGNTPILESVKKAEQIRINNEKTKVYIGPAGSPQFNQLMTQLTLGKDHPALLADRVRTVSTPGGTGALKAAADFIQRCKPGSNIWVSDPTWANHSGIFETAGLTLKIYPYYDHDNKSLKFDDMVSTLQKIDEQDVVLFHACCHNPSGMDLTQSQWDKVISITANRGFTPLIDMAYQGFAIDPDTDAYGVRKMAATVDNMLLCSSCSKNFGLYRERIGACTIITKTPQQANNALSVLLYSIRCIYSMPPAHGAAIVETILGSAELSRLWYAELQVMRNRINGNRQLLVEKLTQAGVKQSFDFITQQKGMFSFLGISADQVKRLKDEFSIYMVDSSRISIAGISKKNVDYLAQSIKAVI